MNMMESTDGWQKETDWTTIEALHKNLNGGPSKARSCTRAFDLIKQEQEILEWYKTFGYFLNVVAHSDPAAGKRFFELDDYTIWDLMGNLRRGNLGPHYDHITPYLGKTNQSFKNVEVVAVTPGFGYITSLQRVHGVATDGSPYDMAFRATTLARKIDPAGEWKLIHEHYSFPVNMATKVADFTSSQALSENVEFQKNE